MVKLPNNKTKSHGKIIDANVTARPRPGIPLDKEQIKEQVMKYHGNLTKVGVALGCSRQAVRRLINTDPELKEVLEEARERIIDDVEDSFIKRCKEGDVTSTIFFLKTRGRERGYDQDFRADLEGVTRAALQFALNKSKNPAENTPKDPA